jgi:hypothetical protein
MVEVSKRINDCISIQELFNLYKVFPQFKEDLKPSFEQRKREILISEETQNKLSNPQNFSTNGLH